MMHQTFERDTTHFQHKQSDLVWQLWMEMLLLPEIHVFPSCDMMKIDEVITAILVVFWGSLRASACGKKVIAAICRREYNIHLCLPSVSTITNGISPFGWMNRQSARLVLICLEVNAKPENVATAYNRTTPLEENTLAWQELSTILTLNLKIWYEKCTISIRKENLLSKLDSIWIVRKHEFQKTQNCKTHFTKIANVPIVPELEPKFAKCQPMKSNADAKKSDYSCVRRGQLGRRCDESTLSLRVDAGTALVRWGVV